MNTPVIMDRKSIEALIDIKHAIEEVERGFAYFSKGNATIPPFASLRFEDPTGEAHIKYGYLSGDRHYVVKIASVFSDNRNHGICPSQGVILVFERNTGQLAALLLDEGYLTDLRTACAGAVAAKYFAPNDVKCIGIVGTGTQARFQLQLLKEVQSCRQIVVWGRNQERLEQFKVQAELSGFEVETTLDMNILTRRSQLIVTTTTSKYPLINVSQIQTGTHITAVGADDLGKQELDPALFAKADCIFVDCKSQCTKFGDTAHAINQGVINSEHLVELGDVILGNAPGRINDNQITVCDLTGVAIQDIQIANCVLKKFLVKPRLN